MRFLTWNIRHGGSSKRLAGIVQALNAHNADTIIITEFRQKSDVPLEEALREQGWNYVFTTKPPAGINGILIASCFEIELASTRTIVPSPPERWLEVFFPKLGLTVCGIHIPGAGDKWDKRMYWRQLVAIGKECVSGDHILVGDFNTGRKIDAQGTPFKYAEFMDDLEAQGWVDAFRAHYPDAREFTWYSSAGNGFRLDYAFLSSNLAPHLTSVHHSQIERDIKLSDHAPLVFDIDLTAVLRPGSRVAAIEVS